MAPQSFANYIAVGSGRSKQPQSKKPSAIIACVMIALVVYVVLCTVAIAVGFSEISKLKSETARLESEMTTLSATFELETTTLKSETSSLQQVISTQPNVSALQVSSYISTVGSPDLHSRYIKQQRGIIPS